MSDWFDDYCFGWSNIPTCELYRWLEANNVEIERAHQCKTAEELREQFRNRLGGISEKDINWKELYETLNFES